MQQSPFARDPPTTARRLQQQRSPADMTGESRVRRAPSWTMFEGMTNTYGSRDTLRVGSKSYDFFRLDALDRAGIATTHLPFSLRILLENLLRTEDGRVVRADDI